MKTLGIIGGIAPESTIEYYRLIIASYRERRPDGGYPPMLINSIDMKKMLGLVGANQLGGLTTYLLDEIERLADAGADIGLLAANTPHIVFTDVRRQSPIPLISIVETACDAARTMGLRTLALFGTRFTMQGRFYPEVFSRHGMTLVTPEPGDQAFIHEHYMGELIAGVFRPETRAEFLAIADRMRAAAGIEAVILGGTEIPLLLREPGRDYPFLDTTRIHVERAVTEMLS
jgi:aspartate racemase